MSAEVMHPGVSGALGDAVARERFADLADGFGPSGDANHEHAADGDQVH